MAIVKMTKVIIASYRDEAGMLLEKLQKEGIIEILNAEQAMVSKEWPELSVEIKRPRDIEDLVGRLSKSIDFLKASTTEKDPTNLFNPRIEIAKSKYTDIVSGKEAMDLLDETEKVSSEIENLHTDYENKQGVYETLHPWRELDTDVEELRNLESATALAGMLPHQHFDEIIERLTELGSALEQVGSTGSMHACVVVCLNDAVSDAQKILRSGDFEAVSFEHFEGTVAGALDDCEEQLARIGVDLGNAKQKAAELATDRLSLQILFDHYSNLLSREQSQATSPATENTVLLEGWVKEHDYAKAEEIVNSLEASSIGKMDIAEDEVVPVEIENNAAIQPFEAVTRLYGMPASFDVDPTVFLAPFFALFFGLCMTDAAYGIIMVAFFAWLARKMKGDKRFVLMMAACSVTTIVAGVLTGGWCGDMIQSFFGEESGINQLRLSLMWFDPLEEPMHFFAISLALGYLQIITGVAIGFFHKFKRKDYTGAIFDHGSWFIWLNSLLIFGLAKAGMVPAVLGKIFIIIAIVPGVAILLFSEREGGWGGRIGMGFYNVFSTVFYVGDVLSYIRLMALGMVTGGFGMAVNEICKSIVASAEGGSAIGSILAYIFAGVVFVGMHLFNIANSALGSFVHSMRLQFVEFFTKFLAGGGKDFEPLRENYTHVSVEE